MMGCEIAVVCGWLSYGRRLCGQSQCCGRGWHLYTSLAEEKAEDLQEDRFVSVLAGGGGVGEGL